jgi:hypothetical protein
MVQAGQDYLVAVVSTERHARERPRSTLYQLTPAEALRLRFTGRANVYTFPVSEVAVCLEGQPCFPCRPGEDAHCNGPVPPARDPFFAVYGDPAELFRTTGIEAYTPEGALLCAAEESCESGPKNTCADSANCGRCGVVCPEQSACKLGRCQRQR